MKSLTLCFLIVFFYGCVGSNKKPRTEEYFSKNIEIAKEVFLKCKKIGTPSTEFKKIECSNANNALMKSIKKPSRADNNYKMGF